MIQRTAIVDQQINDILSAQSSDFPLLILRITVVPNVLTFRKMWYVKMVSLYVLKLAAFDNAGE